MHRWNMKFSMLVRDEWKRNGALIPEEAYASFERTKVLFKIPDYDSGWKRIPLPECNTSRTV